MYFTVHIRPVNRSIEIEAGSTILESALSSGIDYPHGCRSGNCGACKSRLHSGDVEHSPYSPFALSDYEYDDGLILACRTVPWSDCEVSWCEPDEHLIHPIRSLECEVASITRLTHDIVSLKLRILSGGPFAFNPGQFTSLTFLGMPRREYSIASFENGDTLEYYIKKIERGIASPFVFDDLCVGDLLTAEGPFGNMYFREDHQGDIIALAGGSGLSAIQPIVIRALTVYSEQLITLYHGVQSENDLYKFELFENLAEKYQNFDYVPVLSNEKGDTHRRTGNLDEVIESDLQSIENVKAYLAGPPPMVSSCVKILKYKGLTDEHIHADPFLTEADLEVL